MKITFTNTYAATILEKPKPASNYIPEWYKKIESYMGGKKKPSDDGTALATIKRCMPVFDMITAGYIITTIADIYVEPKDGAPYFKWSGFDAIEFHGPDQTTGHPATNKEFASPKFINPWSIKTPKGWSILIMQPAHRDAPFTILPGIVDTDTYTAPINFPFTLKDPNYEGLIPAGTPIAQIIPIKRESWEHEFGNENELTDMKKITQKMNTVFFDRYKRFWWIKKEYK